MSGPAHRVKSSALLGITFGLLSSAILLIGIYLPPYGTSISAAMGLSSPFVWLLWMFKGHSVPRILVFMAVIAPYTLIGLLVGYRWPLSSNIISIGFRLLATVTMLGLAGLFMLLWAITHDS